MRSFANGLLFRFLVGYLLLGGVVACLGFYVVGQLRAQEREITALLEVDTPRHRDLGHCLSLISAELNLLKKALITGDAAFVQRAFEIGGQVEESLGNLTDEVTEDSWRDALHGAREVHWSLWEEGAFERPAGGSSPRLRMATMAELDAALGVFTDLLEGVREAGEEAMRERLGHSRQMVSHARKVSLGGWLVAMGLSLAIAYWTYRNVTRPLQKVSSGTRRWAEGEFDYQVPVSRDDEIGDLAASANRMARQLAELESLKEEFLASCSHELKTPLTSLREANAMMIEGVAGPLTGEQRRLLKISHQELGRLQRRTGQILDFSRIRAGRMEYHFEEVVLDLLLERCLERLGLVAERQGVELVAQELPDGLIVYVDPERITQVFDNLISNAVNYNRPGGRVWCEIEETALDGRLWATISVCDNGLGIPRKDLERIFERFERAHPGVINPDLPGSGLGLAIVRLIVRDHGGDLVVESTPGEGSRFTVRLPAQRRRLHAAA